jgi:2-oxoglutarate dehydrogenase complex dehydrogenase (E1) component-like enzyme
MGKAHSKQQQHGMNKVLNVQVHGDAAVCAQGVVYETLCLAKTPNFNVDGTIHLITNNQIGYTTRPIDSRPSKYATDLFKAYEIPILHINAENIEDVHRAVRLAVEYQCKFRKDILIDLICYRKYGHNEVDEPEFTQPKMYHRIRKEHQPSPVKYTAQLVAKGIAPADFY